MHLPGHEFEEAGPFTALGIEAWGHLAGWDRREEANSFCWDKLNCMHLGTRCIKAH